jgi:uncharacterized protein YecT (DUF1311 family)
MRKLLILVFATTLFGSSCVPLKYLYSTEYEQCTKNTYSTTDMLKCINKELKIQDKKLNQAYKKAMNKIQPFRKEELKKIQRLWIKYRDKKCNFYYHKESGSSGKIDAMECKLNETIKRTIELNEVY